MPDDFVEIGMLVSTEILATVWRAATASTIVHDFLETLLTVITVTGIATAYHV